MATQEKEGQLGKFFKPLVAFVHSLDQNKFFKILWLIFPVIAGVLGWIFCFIVIHFRTIRSMESLFEYAIIRIYHLLLS